jgi:uncharacterized protein (DUF1697 family)
MSQSLRWIALLRGVNVGKTNRLSMADLRDIAVSIGFENVETYIQSGNLVFSTASPESEDGLSNRTREAIASNKDLSVGAIVRPAEDFIALPDRHPSIGMGIDEKPLHVMFLRDVPTSEQIDRLSQRSFGPDGWLLDGRELFVTYPNGSARSKLTINVVERSFETLATARNLGTVRKIAAIASQQ